MDISFTSILIFTILTFFYYFLPSIGKPQLTLDILSAGESAIVEFTQLKQSRAFYYFIAVLVTQFLINTVYMMNKCSGSAGSNMGAAALYTFIPWFFIFGILMIVILIYPVFKSTLSDVAGYFFVSSAANDVFTELLIDTDIQAAMQKDGAAAQSGTAMRQTADAILKIMGNKSVLINQFTPDNFNEMWATILPLVKKTLSAEAVAEKQKELLDLVVTKDNIGEGMWYIYSAILITSIVYYNLATRKCTQSSASINKKYNEYVQGQEVAEKEKEVQERITYSADV